MRKRRPAAFDELRVGIFVARRSGDALRRPLGAVAVARAVQRIEHGLGEAASLGEHAVREVCGIVAEVAAGLQVGFADQVMQNELQVFEWGAIHVLEF